MKEEKTKKKFNKKLLTFGVLGLFAMVFVTAGLMTYFGVIKQEVTVEQGLTVDGEAWNQPITEGVTMTSLDAKQITSGHYLKNIADVDATVYLNTICTGIDYCVDIGITTDTVGLSTKWSSTAGSFADASMTGNVVTLDVKEDSSSATITILASDVGITTLSQLETMSWAVTSGVGYAPHVDVYLDTLGDGGDADQSLNFEYAKVDIANCDTPATYPIGDFDTFKDNGIVDLAAMAWLNSGPAGPCTETTSTGDMAPLDGFIFENTYKSLAEWKTEYPNAKILRFEIEVEAWISDSSSDISTIVINGHDVVIDTLSNPVIVEGKSGLAFYVNSDFPKMLKPGTYTITTVVDDTA